MLEPITIQSQAGTPEQLLLLFHGVGSAPQDMVPLGRLLATEFPRAAVISVPSPDASDMGSGYQWFSVHGITEDNRAQRIADTMPRFVDIIRRLQKCTGATPDQTVLIGFSQGAIMALASSQTSEQLAGRIVAIAGRFARPPEKAPIATTLHFIHGDRDPVVPYSHTVRAAERLVRLGADVTSDVISGLDHGINRHAADRLIERLKQERGQSTAT
jgi:phospholipase/carboxylesterase